MPNYRVHIYREMRLVFDHIEAETPQQAAHLAAERHSDDCDHWSDCEGTTLAALVDLNGTTAEGEEQDAVAVDFEDGRFLKSGRRLLAALSAVLLELDAEIEQRRHGGNAEDWTALQRISDEGHGAVREAKGGAA